MEHTLYQFNADGSEMKLTGEELIITTAELEETLALKSIKYIRVSDLTDEYQTDLKTWELKRKANKWFFEFGILVLLPGLCGFFLHPGLGFVVTTFSMVFLIPSFLALRELRSHKPVLFSAIRIKTVVEERYFPIAQNTYSRVNLAAFVTHVERALSQVNNPQKNDVLTSNPNTMKR